MNTKSIIAIALAALLVFAGGAAALPSQAAGADAADEHQPDDPGANASDHTDENDTDTDGNATDADDARDENASDGPPTEMPEQAPDHVTEIHQLIRDKLAGNLTGQELGAAISGLMGNGDDAPADSAGEQSENADENATETNNESEDAEETATETEGQSTTTSASVLGNLPGQAADHVSQIHDAIQSFLNGDSDGNPGDEVSSTAG